VGAVLEAESGLNDAPSVVVVSPVVSGAWANDSPWVVVGLVVYELVAGAVVGYVLGLAGRWLLPRLALPVAGLYPVTLLARVGVSTAPFRFPARIQAFLSVAGLRGAVPIVLATLPLAARTPGATRVFDITFVLVLVFTALQAPTLPWFARRFGVVAAGEATEL